MYTSPKINHVCSPKLCKSIVFYFSRDHCITEEKSKTEVMQNVGGGGGGGPGGANKVYNRRFANGEKDNVSAPGPS